MKKIIRVIGNTFYKMYENMHIEKQLIDRDIDELISNPKDRDALIEAVEYLKQNKDEKTKEITLSDNETLIISIS